jgi:hypothetical protein
MYRVDTPRGPALILERAKAEDYAARHGGMLRMLVLVSPPDCRTCKSFSPRGCRRTAKCVGGNLYEGAWPVYYYED